MSTPTVGRIVHVKRGMMTSNECEAAIVTSPANENDGYFHVSVFTSIGGVYPMFIKLDDVEHWHWPERQ